MQHIRFHGGKFEEDVCSHDIDPEHEWDEGVKGDVANEYTAKRTSLKQPIDRPAEIVAGQTKVGNKVIEDKSDGNLSKQRAMKVRINNIGNKG